MQAGLMREGWRICGTLRYYLYKISTSVIAYTVVSLYTTSTETYLGTGEGQQLAK